MNQNITKNIADGISRVVDDNRLAVRQAEVISVDRSSGVKVTIELDGVQIDDVPCFNSVVPSAGDSAWVMTLRSGRWVVIGHTSPTPGGATVTEDLVVDGILTANHIHGNIAGSVYLHVKNTSGATIPAGSPVYATGSVGASGATEIARSDANLPATMPALGVLQDSLANNEEGHATVLGVAKNLDTSAWSINDSLYVSNTGTLTNVRPTATTDLIQKIARVIRVNASTGEILVLGAGRTNDVPNEFSITGSMGVGTSDLTYRLNVDNGVNGNIFRLKGADDTLDFTVSAGDWSILNSGQSNGLVIYDGTGGVEIWYNGSAVFEADSDGVKVSGSRILTEADEGSGQGLDADTLDGSHSSAFAASVHTHSYAATTHTHTYVPLAGGTMTGELQVNARLDVGDGTGNDHEIRIYKADNNVSDHIQFYNGTTRIGEIGCEDTSWLRINQETATNIYTPRYIRADAGFFVDGSTYGITGTGAGYFNGNVEAVSGNVVVTRPNAIMLAGSADNNHKIYSLNNADTALPWSDGPVMVGYSGWGFYSEQENVWRMGLRGNSTGTQKYGWYNCNLMVGTAPDDALNTYTLRVQGSGYFNSTIYVGTGTSSIDVLQIRNEVQASDGSATDPSYTFSSDGDVGIYRNATNQLSLTAGGSAGVVVASGTCVTASPATTTTSGYQYVLRNNTYGTLYRYSSTIELKEQVADFDGSGELIDALRPVTFVPKFVAGQPTPDDQDDEFDPTVETEAQRIIREADLQYGFIAEEVATVGDGKLAQYEWTEDGQLRAMGWKWPDLIAVLTAEVKSLRARVASLESA